MTYEQYLISITYTFVGAVILLITIVLIGSTFNSIITTWENKRYVHEKQIHRLCITGTRDWCEYDFPQVGYAVRHILDVIDNKKGHSDDWFRKELRDGKHIREGTWEWACKMMEEGHIVHVKSRTSTIKYKVDNEDKQRVMCNFDDLLPEAPVGSSWINATLLLSDFKKTDWQIFK